MLLFDTVQSELEEKIRRLEEDRHSIDITSGAVYCGFIFLMQKMSIVCSTGVSDLNFIGPDAASSVKLNINKPCPLLIIVS